MELWPKVNQPREMNLKGKVQLKTQAEKSGEARMLQTSALLLEFADGKKDQGRKLKRAETLGQGESNGQTRGRRRDRGSSRGQ